MGLAIELLLVLVAQKTLIHAPLLLSLCMPFEKELELPELSGEDIRWATFNNSTVTG